MLLSLHIIFIFILYAFVMLQEFTFAGRIMGCGLNVSLVMQNTDTSLSNEALEEYEPFLSLEMVYAPSFTVSKQYNQILLKFQ